MAKIRSSLLNLVDLAGSERQRDTHTEGLRLKVVLSNVCMCVQLTIAHTGGSHVSLYYYINK